MPKTEPDIYQVQTPGNYRESYEGIFQPSTVVVDFRVDYSQVVAGQQKKNLNAVLADMREQSYQIYNGRPLQLGGTPPPSPLVNYRSYYSASSPLAYIGTVNGAIVRSIEGHIIDRSACIWHISVRLDYVGYNNLYERIHANVVATSSTRTVSAYRVGPTLNLITDSSAFPKLGAVTENAIFGPCTGSNARTGTYAQSNWITLVKSTMDVGGVPVDINGQPVSIPIEQLNYTLQFVIRRPYLEGTIPGGPASPSSYGSRTVDCTWELWGQYPEWCLNKRNAEAMFGYGPGQLVCTAVNNTPIDDEYMICSVTLTWDEWGHCDQAPWGFEGNIPPKSETTLGGADRPILNADTVYWINPVQESFNWASADFPYGVHDVFSEMILPAI